MHYVNTWVSKHYFSSDIDESLLPGVDSTPVVKKKARGKAVNTEEVAGGNPPQDVLVEGSAMETDDLEEDIVEDDVLEDDVIEDDIVEDFEEGSGSFQPVEIDEIDDEFLDEPHFSESIIYW